MKVYYVGSRRLRYSVIHKRLDCKDDLKHIKYDHISYIQSSLLNIVLYQLICFTISIRKKQVKSLSQNHKYKKRTVQSSSLKSHPFWVALYIRLRHNLRACTIHRSSQDTQDTRLQGRIQDYQDPDIIDYKDPGYKITRIQVTRLHGSRIQDYKD